MPGGRGDRSWGLKKAALGSPAAVRAPRPAARTRQIPLDAWHCFQKPLSGPRAWASVGGLLCLGASRYGWAWALRLPGSLQYTKILAPAISLGSTSPISPAARDTQCWLPQKEGAAPQQPLGAHGRDECGDPCPRLSWVTPKIEGGDCRPDSPSPSSGRVLLPSQEAWPSPQLLTSRPRPIEFLRIWLQTPSLAEAVWREGGGPRAKSYHTSSPASSCMALSSSSLDS